MFQMYKYFIHAAMVMILNKINRLSFQLILGFPSLASASIHRAGCACAFDSSGSTPAPFQCLSPSSPVSYLLVVLLKNEWKISEH